MLTVATSDVLTGPTRLLFPRLPSNPGGEAASFPFSLLGIFALRFCHLLIRPAIAHTPCPAASWQAAIAACMRTLS